jgi:hypothetical protein
MRKIFLLFVLALSTIVSAQTWNAAKRCEVDANGNCSPTTILTGMPFLRIAPDARGGAMGDAGIATEATGASMHYNPSNIMFAKDNSAMSLNFTPWLQDLGVNDLYLTYLSGYKKLDDRQAVGFNLRYFSLGEIIFTDITGFELGTGKPREFEIGAAYTRKLGDYLSAAISGKFLYSNLAGGQVVNGVFISSATSFATDISMTYKKPATIGGYKGSVGFGINLSNLGSKVSYTANVDKDFIPTNLGIGGGLTMEFDDYNKINFALDVNKLMVPSPISISNVEQFDVKPKNNIPDWRERSLFEGVLGSFNDAQGGFAEELKEFNFSAGAEYVYDNQFSVRAGYYYENPLKGARKYLTAGVGIRYNVFEFNISYLAPSSIQRSPLDNTLRFGLNFNFEDFKNTLEE